MCLIFVSSSVSGDSFSFSYIYSCTASLIGSTDISLFGSLSLAHNPRGIFLLLSFEAMKLAAAVVVMNSQFFSKS